MFGNGARTGIMTATMARRQTAAPGIRLQVNIVFGGAALGAATRSTAVQPVASGTTLTTEASTLPVFVWRSVLNSVFCGGCRGAAPARDIFDKWNILLCCRLSAVDSN